MYRTRTQAFFSMITSWDYPAEFYARLALHWPTLAFACSVNEEMGSFGGIVIGVNGEATNLVEYYGAAGYSRRMEARCRCGGSMASGRGRVCPGRRASPDTDHTGRPCARILEAKEM